MRLPLDYIYVTNVFGYKGATKWYAFHNGIDIRANKVALYAPESGTLKRVNTTAGGYGIYLTTATGTHVFWHLSGRVRDGIYKAGAKIGTTGNSGKWTTAAHLHWGLKINGVYVDPLKKTRKIMDKIKELQKAYDNAHANWVAFVKKWRDAEKKIVNLETKIDELNKKLSDVPVVDEEEAAVNWLVKLINKLKEKI